PPGSSSAHAAPQTLGAVKPGPYRGAQPEARRKPAPGPPTTPPVRRRRSGHRMNPFHVLSALVGSFLIKVLTGPGQSAAGAAREYHLEELQAAGTKSSSGTG